MAPDSEGGVFLVTCLQSVFVRLVGLSFLRTTEEQEGFSEVNY
jgi:hypothetical protein